MSKPSPQFLVYVTGAVLLGLFYGPVKSALGGEWVFLVVVVAYLLALRWLGDIVARALAARKRGDDV